MLCGCELSVGLLLVEISRFVYCSSVLLLSSISRLCGAVRSRDYTQPDDHNLPTYGTYFSTIPPITYTDTVTSL